MVYANVDIGFQCGGESLLLDTNGVVADFEKRRGIVAFAVSLELEGLVGFEVCNGHVSGSHTATRSIGYRADEGSAVNLSRRRFS